MRAPPGGASRAELRKLADEELVQLVAASDADAFEVVFERHADAAFALAYRMCGRRFVAEDVAQEAFLALWRGARRYDRTRGSVRTWALGIVHNRAVDALRRSSVHDRRRAHEEGAESFGPEQARLSGWHLLEPGNRDEFQGYSHVSRGSLTSRLAS